MSRPEQPYILLPDLSWERVPIDQLDGNTSRLESLSRGLQYLISCWRQNPAPRHRLFSSMLAICDRHARETRRTRDDSNDATELLLQLRAADIVSTESIMRQLGIPRELHDPSAPQSSPVRGRSSSNVWIDEVASMYDPPPLSASTNPAPDEVPTIPATPSKPTAKPKSTLTLKRNAWLQQKPAED